MVINQAIFLYHHEEVLYMANETAQYLKKAKESFLIDDAQSSAGVGGTMFNSFLTHDHL